MKKLLFAICILALAACSKMPRTVVVDNNPRYCWSCKAYTEINHSYPERNSRQERDTLICNKLGLEITDIMQQHQTSSVRIGDYMISTTHGIDQCKIQ